MTTRAASRTTGKPQKSKAELAARIDEKLRELRLHSGPDEFDPVVLCAIIAAESYDNGDLAMALAAAREVAQYVRPKLQAVQLQADIHMDVEVMGAKDRFLALARAQPALVMEITGEMPDEADLMAELARPEPEDEIAIPENKPLTPLQQIARR